MITFCFVEKKGGREKEEAKKNEHVWEKIAFRSNQIFEIFIHKKSTQILLV